MPEFKFSNFYHQKLKKLAPFYPFMHKCPNKVMRRHIRWSNFWKYQKADSIFGFPAIKLAGIFEFLTQAHHHQQKMNFDPLLSLYAQIRQCDVTAGGKILRISKNWLHFWIPHPKISRNTNFWVSNSSTSIRNWILTLLYAFMPK